MRPCPIDGFAHEGVPDDSPDRYCSFCMRSLGLRRAPVVASPEVPVVFPNPAFMEVQAARAVKGLARLDRYRRGLSRALGSR